MNSAFVQVLTAIAMVLTIVVPMTYYFKGEHNKNRYKKSLAANVSGFFGLLLIATVVSFAGATTASAATEAGAGLATGLGYLGAALVTGLSFRYWFRYRRCIFRKRSSWSNQRRRQHLW